MCIIVIVLNLIAFLHSGLVTIRDTEAIIRPKPTNYGNESSSKFMSCFSAPVSRQNSRASSASISHIDNHYPDIHGSSHSVKSLKSTMNDRSSLYNSNGDLAKMGADLERLDRDRSDIIHHIRDISYSLTSFTFLFILLSFSYVIQSRRSVIGGGI